MFSPKDSSFVAAALFFQQVNYLAALACPRVNLLLKDGGEWAGPGSSSSQLSFITTSLSSAADLPHLGNRNHTLLGPVGQIRQKRIPFEIIHVVNNNSINGKRIY